MNHDVPSFEKPRISEHNRQRWLRRIAFYEQEEKIERAEGDEQMADITLQTIATIREWIKCT